MAFKRMAKYLAEAHLHMERLMDVLERIKIFYPLNVDKFDKLTSIQKDMLDALAFRFMKLQDLLGSKIFREYLIEMGFVAEDKTFFDILKEVENENIVDIDTWSEFRKVRNILAHDYPDNMEEKLEAINYLIENSPILLKVVDKIEDKVNSRRT
ncbi:hypothetical protein [Hippea jasoniae]|uniref:hypothetical protein n=1 Tax=Hippea jasoniae TaxID=944479 RepID=UPI00055847A9|nr:hypothetical protein [Hippea jasoniae]